MSRAAATATAAAIAFAVRTPYSSVSTPPMSAPMGAAPMLKVRNDATTRPSMCSGVTSCRSDWPGTFDATIRNIVANKRCPDDCDVLREHVDCKGDRDRERCDRENCRAPESGGDSFGDDCAEYAAHGSDSHDEAERSLGRPEFVDDQNHVHAEADVGSKVERGDRACETAEEAVREQESEALGDVARDSCGSPSFALHRSTNSDEHRGTEGERGGVDEERQFR